MVKGLWSFRHGREPELSKKKKKKLWVLARLVLTPHYLLYVFYLFQVSLCILEFEYDLGSQCIGSVDWCVTQFPLCLIFGLSWAHWCYCWSCLTASIECLCVWSGTMDLESPAIGSNRGIFWLIFISYVKPIVAHCTPGDGQLTNTPHCGLCKHWSLFMWVMRELQSSTSKQQPTISIIDIHIYRMVNK